MVELHLQNDRSIHLSQHIIAPHSRPNSLDNSFIYFCQYLFSLELVF